MENAFEPSIRAARALGPKTGIPTERILLERSQMDGRRHTFAKVRLYTIDKRLFGPRKDKRDLET